MTIQRRPSRGPATPVCPLRSRPRPPGDPTQDAQTGSSLRHHLFSQLPQAPRERPFSRPAHCPAPFGLKIVACRSTTTSLSRQSPPTGAGPCLRTCHPVRSNKPGWCHRNAPDPQLPPRMTPRGWTLGGGAYTLTTPPGWANGFNHSCTRRSEFCFPLKFGCGNPNSRGDSMGRWGLRGAIIKKTPQSSPPIPPCED